MTKYKRNLCVRLTADDHEAVVRESRRRAIAPSTYARNCISAIVNGITNYPDRFPDQEEENDGGHNEETNDAMVQASR